MADKGGVVGIYMLPYYTASPKQPMLDDYMYHLEHALKDLRRRPCRRGSDVPFFRVDDSDLEEMKKGDRKAESRRDRRAGRRPPDLYS